jgi:hypothetical protein
LKSPLLGLAVSTLAFAGSTIYLWVQLDEERARADEVTALTRRLNDRVAELEKARGDFERMRLADIASPLPGRALESVAGVTAPAKSGDATVASATAQFEFPRPDRSPGYQKMMRAQMRANNRRMYADIGATLGLSQEETGKLIDLLTDQQLANMTRARDTPSGREEDMQQQWDRIRREQHAEIANLLGADKAEGFRKYQESLPARGEVEMIARQLDGSDAPLKDEQRKRLIAIITEERGRIPMPQIDQVSDPEAHAKAANDWQEDYEQRVNAQARAILDNEQYDAYSEYQQWQREMREQFAVSRRNMIPWGNVVQAPQGAVSFAVAAPATPPEPAKK